MEVAMLGVCGWIFGKALMARSAAEEEEKKRDHLHSVFVLSS